jgi:hypothetical protein
MDSYTFSLHFPNDNWQRLFICFLVIHLSTLSCLPIFQSHHYFFQLWEFSIYSRYKPLLDSWFANIPPVLWVAFYTADTGFLVFWGFFCVLRQSSHIAQAGTTLVDSSALPQFTSSLDYMCLILFLDEYSKFSWSLISLFFSFVICSWGAISKKLSPTPMSWSFSLCFCLRVL